MAKLTLGKVALDWAKARGTVLSSGGRAFPEAPVVAGPSKTKQQVKGTNMGFVDAVKSGFGKYVTFSGRAARSEYWWWVLFVVILSIIGFAIDGIINPASVTTEMGDGTVGVSSTGGPVSMIISLAMLLPGLAVSVRRLHDIDKSGWWILIGLVPLVGFILLIVWYCTKGTMGSNRFGEDPLGGR